MSINFFEIKSEEKERYQKQLGKTQEEINEYVVLLRHWIKQNKYLPQDIETEFLEVFLKGSKFSTEVCKKKIECFYRNKCIFKEVFENRSPLHQTIQNSFKKVVVLTLPKLTHDLCRVIIVRSLCQNEDDYEIWDFFKLVSLLLDLKMKNDLIVRNHIIVDCHGITIEILSKVSLSLLKKIYKVGQTGNTQSFSGIHLLNFPDFINIFFNQFMFVLDDKMRSRIKFHNNLESLYEYIPQTVLPTEYGGSEISLMELNNHWKSYLESLDDWFVQQNDKRTNEKLEESELHDEQFGIKGTFRKLNID